MVASVALVLGFTVPADAATIDEPVFEAELVAPIESPPVEVPASQVPEGDYSSLADVSESAAGARVEYFTETSIGESSTRFTGKTGDIVPLDVDDAEVLERSEFETVYSNPDGGGTTVSSVLPLNAENDEDEWVPVRSQLFLQPDGSYSTDAHPLDPELAPTASDDGVFAVSREGYRVEFTLEGAADSEIKRDRAPRAVTDGDDFSYDEVFEGVDLEFEVERGWVKEALVLSELPSRADASWTWLIDADGLDLRFDEFGDIEFVNLRDEVKFHIPVPVMWDSSGVPGVSEDALANVEAEISETDDGWELTLTPDYAWLSDEDRVFPVSIDPTMVSGEAGRVAYKSDGVVRTDATLVGNSRNAGDRYWRTVNVYPYSGLNGLQVLDFDPYARNPRGFDPAVRGSVESRARELALYQLAEGASDDDPWYDVNVAYEHYAARSLLKIADGYLEAVWLFSTGIDGNPPEVIEAAVEKEALRSTAAVLGIVGPYPANENAMISTGMRLTRAFRKYPGGIDEFESKIVTLSAWT